VAYDPGDEGVPMEEKLSVLVGYATAAGSTRGVAERIARRLGDAGLLVTCAPLGPELHPDDFGAWVLGSAVHNMAWLPRATDFLAGAARTPRPCWAFSVGGLAPTGPVRRWMAGREIRRVQRGFPPGLAVRDHQLFAGVSSTQGVSRAGRAFWRALGGRPGDQRDWAAIDRWASGVAAELSARFPAGREQRTSRST
jgi:menaquinone-dependent protoporphyrinogen oxidase